MTKEPPPDASGVVGGRNAGTAGASAAVGVRADGASGRAAPRPATSTTVAAATAASMPRATTTRKPVWRRWTPGRWLKPLVFALALAPFVALVQGLFAGSLGPNPVEALTDHTGTLAIRFLLIGLALTPLRWLLGNVWPLRLRRMLGLFAFFYVALHVTIYVVLDRELELALVLEDLTERPYVMAGFAALLVLIPLAATSTKGMARRLGRRWQGLHRWVYVASAAAVVHYVWLARGDRIEPFVYLAVLAVLLGWRLLRLMKEGGAR